MKIAIVGSGYVGLVTGACFAQVGHQVICVDNDERKVEMLRSGEVPIYEPGLEQLVQRNLSANRLSFADSIQEQIGSKSSSSLSNRQNMKMTQHLTLVRLVSTLSVWLLPALLGAGRMRCNTKGSPQCKHVPG